jgi:hypothetical protein
LLRSIDLPELEDSHHGRFSARFYSFHRSNSFRRLTSDFLTATASIWLIQAVTRENIGFPRRPTNAEINPNSAMKKTTIPHIFTLIIILLAGVGIGRAATYSGTLINAVAPTQIAPGNHLNITVLVQNTGSITWIPFYGSWVLVVSNASWSPPGWSDRYVSYQDVNPSQKDSVVFMVPTGHLSAGNYSLKVYAYHDAGLGGSLESYPLMTGAPKTVQFQLSDMPPAIATQPASRIVRGGTYVTFSPDVVGSLPLQYQWRFRGANIPGATSSDLNLSNVQPSHSGNYSLVVSNHLGSTTSSNAVLTVTCDYSLSSSAAYFNYEGGRDSVVMNTGCHWTIANTNSWITIEGSTNRTGYKTVYYTVSTNLSTASRVGRVSIAGKTFTVTQGPQLAPYNLRGKTLTMYNSSGNGTLPFRGRYLVVTRGGTNNILQVVPLAGPIEATNAPCTFRRIDGRTASFSYGDLTTTLHFYNPVSGTFDISKPDGSSSFGSFVMAESRPDVNADGRPDILWQNGSTRGLNGWLMSGTNWIRNVPIHFGMSPPSGWSAVGSADFNNDGDADILFHAPNMTLNAWLLKRTNIIGTVALRFGTSTGTNQRVITAADFTGDSRSDVLLQSDSGAVSLWTFSLWTYLNTFNIRGGQSAGLGWRAVAAADFNRDGQTDILFQHSNGPLALWLMNGVNFVSSVGLLGTPTMGSTWRVQGAADFDSDGEPDILWRNSTGEMRIWRMKNRSYLGSIVLPLNPSSIGLNCISPN